MATNPSKYAWDQPVDEVSQTTYPLNKAMQTESGHLQEFDDTKGAERIRTQHRLGTYTEMRANGDKVVSVVGDGYEIISKNKNVLIKGICNITVEGDCVMEVKGDYKQRIKGNFTQEVQGDYDLLLKGRSNISSVKNLNIGILSGASGKVNIRGADGLSLSGDLNVGGSITGMTVTSTGAMTVGTGMQVGIPGSVNPYAGIQTLGGINVGLPPAVTVPGVVNVAGLVTAPAVVGTVVTYGGVLLDVLGGAPIIRSIYTTHIHPHPEGPTGTPIAPMPLP
jgi:hypothetical protein